MNLFIIGIGLFTIICTYFKPNFYWESRKAVRMRNLLGDTYTSLLYYGIGAVVIGIGIMEIIKGIN